MPLELNLEHQTPSFGSSAVSVAHILPSLLPLFDAEYFLIVSGARAAETVCRAASL